MSTWQIFSDSDNSFRWETSDAQGLTKPVEEASGAPTRPYDYPSRLPSMVDLLLQGNDTASIDCQAERIREKKNRILCFMMFLFQLTNQKLASIKTSRFVRLKKWKISKHNCLFLLERFLLF